MPKMKLGKLAPKPHYKTIPFAAFLKDTSLPVPPEKSFWEYKIPPETIGMFGNDQYGDCTCAEIAHHLMLLTAHTGTMVVPTDAEVLALYALASPGFDPSTDANDNGAAITDVLNLWQTVGLAGHKIDGWAAIDPTNYAHRNLATYLFGGCSVGVQLPNGAQDQFSAGQRWSVVPGDSIEGGHCIMESGYGSAGRNFETWGKGDQKATNDWDKAYVDEVYVPLTHDWIDAASGVSPTALNYGALQDALAALRQ
jgi:hypothetical protein